MLFVCAPLPFIPHEPRKIDTHSLSKYSQFDFNPIIDKFLFQVLRGSIYVKYYCRNEV